MRVTIEERTLPYDCANLGLPVSDRQHGERDLDLTVPVTMIDEASILVASAARLKLSDKEKKQKPSRSYASPLNVIK